jgi:DNA modification methylase
LAAIVASLRRFGQQKPIVVDCSGVVRAGNGTLEAAKQLGWETIECVETPLKGSEATAYAIADNRTAELAEWDDAILAATLNGLVVDDAELLQAVGFDEAELMKLLQEAEPEKEIVEDEIPEDPPAICKPDDLWILGEHRLLCGDSTKAEDVARLMGGEKAGLTVVDPPFEMSDMIWRQWIADPSIVFGQARHIRVIPEELWRFERIILKKYRHRSATVQIDHRHAFVVQCGKVKTLPHSSETFPSVVEQESEREHDHAKPVKIIVEHMTQWTPSWNLVVDPFLGSGSTMIAAEHLGRKCYGLEIEPRNCDVILNRWETLTGQKASLESKVVQT